MTSPSKVIVTAGDSGGHIVMISRVSTAAVAAGISPEDCIGKRFWDFHVAEEHEKVRRAYLECLATNETQSIETVSTIRGQRERWKTWFFRTEMPTEIVAIAEQIPLNGVAELTPEETEVLRLLGDDLATSDVMQDMQLSRGKFYPVLDSLKRKLGVNTIHGLTLRASKLGLL